MSRRRMGWILAAVLACGEDEGTGPATTEERAIVCEPGATVVTEIPVARLPDLRSRGGFVARLLVDKNITATEGVVFRRITDALQAARATRQSQTTARCRITIQVSAGDYVGTTGANAAAPLEQFPLVIDMPDVSVIGAYEVSLATSGRPSGARPESRPASVLSASPALTQAGGTTNTTRYSEPMFVVNSDGTAGGVNALIQGFVMRSGHAPGDTARGGVGVLSLRATGVQVIGNSMEGNFTERVDVRSGSIVVERNYSAGPGGTCDICINGPGGPFIVRSNLLIEGGLPGVLVFPALVLPLPPGLAQLTLPATSSTQVTIDNNEVSGHQNVPVGAAYRIGAVGNGAPNVVGSTTVTLTRNLAVSNRFGLIVEAGFPAAGSALRGDVTINASGNTFQRSCQADLLVSLSRHTTGLGLGALPFLRNSTYTLNLGPELPWSSAWFAHPADLGNTLMVNGAAIANDRRAPYDAGKACP